jgi:hypothetical protein
MKIVASARNKPPIATAIGGQFVLMFEKSFSCLVLGSRKKKNVRNWPPRGGHQLVTEIRRKTLRCISTVTDDYNYQARTYPFSHSLHLIQLHEGYAVYQRFCLILKPVVEPTLVEYWLLVPRKLQQRTSRSLITPSPNMAILAPAPGRREGGENELPALSTSEEWCQKLWRSGGSLTRWTSMLT